MRHVPSSKSLQEKLSARLFIQHGDEYVNLSAFDDVLTTIAGTTNVTATALLESKAFTVITYDNNIISSVEV